MLVDNLHAGIFVILFVVAGHFNVNASDDLPHYKMCVPHHIFEACKEMMSKPSEEAVIECVWGRDRMDCLEKVNKRQADFLAVDPEDMYVAFNMKNEDFSVFSEIRTLEEPEAEFRYEGIILVHKDSNIKTIADLKGKKSCHTGYGRNVGYKIPITKLRKHGVLQISDDPKLSPVEKELKSLSEFFEKSCLVGNYSPNDKINQELKKRYSNLCELCEDPGKCNYPDKYSGYDGSIRCLVEKGGDVAFTKVIYVRKFFDLPIGSSTTSKTEASADPEKYEYLCEDGSRKPVTGTACSWAQRPWQGYMGNADVNSRLKRLQDRMKAFYEEGKQYENKDVAKKMWINEKNTVVSKDKTVLPGDHLIAAMYKDVIERDGSMQQKIRFCVRSDIELRKCNVLRQAAYSRNVRPEFECVEMVDCIKAVDDKNADICVVAGLEHLDAKKQHLKPILYEQYDPTDVPVVIAEKNYDNDMVQKAPFTFNADSLRSRDAALYFLHKRNKPICPAKLASTENAAIEIVCSKTLDQPKYATKELICPDLSRKSITEFKTCNFEATIPNGIFVRNDVDGHELDNIVHAFASLSEEFGVNGDIEDVFEMFGEFEPAHKNVLFNDDAVKFVAQPNYVQTIDEELYNRLHCLDDRPDPMELYQPGQHY